MMTINPQQHGRSIPVFLAALLYRKKKGVLSAINGKHRLVIEVIPAFRYWMIRIPYTVQIIFLNVIIRSIFVDKGHDSKFLGVKELGD